MELKDTLDRVGKHLSMKNKMVVHIRGSELFCTDGYILHYIPVFTNYPDGPYKWDQNTLIPIESEIDPYEMIVNKPSQRYMIPFSDRSDIPILISKYILPDQIYLRMELWKLILPLIPKKITAITISYQTEPTHIVSIPIPSWGTVYIACAKLPSSAITELK